MISNFCELNIKHTANHFPIWVAKPFNCVPICNVKQVILHLHMYKCIWHKLTSTCINYHMWLFRKHSSWQIYAHEYTCTGTVTYIIWQAEAVIYDWMTLVFCLQTGALKWLTLDLSTLNTLFHGMTMSRKHWGRVMGRGELFYRYWICYL